MATASKEEQTVVDILKDIMPLLTAAGDGKSHGGLSFLQQWPVFVENQVKSRDQFISGGDLANLVKKIVLRSFNSTVHYGWKWSCLMWAVYYERLEIVNHLLENGADIRVVDEDGRTAVHRAAFWGKIRALEAILNSPHVKHSDLAEACSLQAKSCGKNCMDLAAIAKCNSEDCKKMLAPFCSLSPPSTNATPAAGGDSSQASAGACNKSNAGSTKSGHAGKPTKDKVPAAVVPLPTAIATTSTSSEVPLPPPMSEETKQALHAFQVNVLAKLQAVRKQFVAEMDELRRENESLRARKDLQGL